MLRTSIHFPRTPRPRYHPSNINAANLITTTRIAASPYLSYCILVADYQTAAIGCLIAGLSDIADGYIAREYGLSTRLGAILDPLADKILVLSLAVPLAYQSLLPWELLSVIAFKDAYLLAGTVLLSGNSDGVSDIEKVEIQPSTLGKLNTGLTLSTLGVALVHPLLPLGIWYPEAFTGLCATTAATTVASGVQYVRDGGRVGVVRK